MNSITRKLVLSILTVVLTVVALGTTTFAWFTLTNTAVVQPFQAEITSDTGIEVALGIPTTGEEDELNWVTTLTTTAIQDYIEAAFGEAFTFTHVTTANAIDFETLGTVDMTGTTSGYLTIPLNFRSNSANRILWSTVSLSSGLASWQADVAFTGAKGASYIAGASLEIDAADSFRVAVIGNVGGATNVVGYENPDSTTNVVLDGDGVAMDLSGLTEDHDNDVLTPEVNIGVNGAMNYFYRKNASLPFGVNAVTVLDTIQALAENPVLDMASSETAGAAYYGQVLIRVWLEGWDANAYNSVLGRMITASFVFTGTTI
jgi:hypothetical protein